MDAGVGPLGLGVMHRLTGPLGALVPRPWVPGNTKSPCAPGGPGSRCRVSRGTPWDLRVPAPRGAGAWLPLSTRSHGAPGGPGGRCRIPRPMHWLPRPPVALVPLGALGSLGAWEQKIPLCPGAQGPWEPVQDYVWSKAFMVPRGAGATGGLGSRCRTPGPRGHAPAFRASVFSPVNIESVPEPNFFENVHGQIFAFTGTFRESSRALFWTFSPILFLWFT